MLVNVDAALNIQARTGNPLAHVTWCVAFLDAWVCSLACLGRVHTGRDETCGDGVAKAARFVVNIACRAILLLGNILLVHPD
jgi:hypothetical protein